MSIKVDQIAQGDEGCVAITLPINKCHVRDNDVVVMLNFYEALGLAQDLEQSTWTEREALDMLPKGRDMVLFDGQEMPRELAENKRSAGAYVGNGEIEELS